MNYNQYPFWTMDYQAYLTELDRTKSINKSEDKGQGAKEGEAGKPSPQ